MSTDKSLRSTMSMGWPLRELGAAHRNLQIWTSCYATWKEILPDIFNLVILVTRGCCQYCEGLSQVCQVFFGSCLFFIYPSSEISNVLTKKETGFDISTLEPVTVQNNMQINRMKEWNTER